MAFQLRHYTWCIGVEEGMHKDYVRKASCPGNFIYRTSLQGQCLEN